MTRTILITGAAGNIGAKITAHFRETTDHQLRLLDKRASGDILAAEHADQIVAQIQSYIARDRTKELVL